MPVPNGYLAGRHDQQSVMGMPEGGEPDPSQPSVSRRATLRLGARERVRLQAAVIGGIILLLAAALRPILANLVETRDFQTCQTNVRKIAQALTIYSQEWDDAYPSSRSWLDAVRGRMSATTGTGFNADHYLRCPKDSSNGASSYAYNALMEGLSITVRQQDPAKIERRRRLRRLDHAVLVIEKHGSSANAAVSMAEWDDVRRLLDVPHHVPEPTGSLILGSGRAWFESSDTLANYSGRRF